MSLADAIELKENWFESYHKEKKRRNGNATLYHSLGMKG